MSRSSNWSSSNAAAHSSSRPESDKALYPSRLARVPINPRIPLELESWLRNFVIAKKRQNRKYSLQDAVTEALERFRAEVTAPESAVTQSRSHAVTHSPPEESARPVTQFPKRTGMQTLNESGRAVTQSVDQITTRFDDRKDIDDRSTAFSNSNDGDELHAKFCSALGLSKQAIETWFRPLKLSAEDRTMVIAAPNDLARVWIEQRYKPELSKALAVLGFETWRWVVPQGVEASAVDEATIAAPAPMTAADREEELLAFFEVVTEKRVDDKDRAAIRTVAYCRPESIRLGIYRAQISCMKRKEKVGSFKYCVPGILQVQKAGEPALRLLDSTEKEFLQMKQMSLLGGEVRDLK